VHLSFLQGREAEARLFLNHVARDEKNIRNFVNANYCLFFFSDGDLKNKYWNKIERMVLRNKVLTEEEEKEIAEKKAAAGISMPIPKKSESKNLAPRGIESDAQPPLPQLTDLEKDEVALDFVEQCCIPFNLPHLG
jgi:hypothetical protein